MISPITVKKPAVDGVIDAKNGTDFIAPGEVLAFECTQGTDARLYCRNGMIFAVRFDGETARKYAAQLVWNHVMGDIRGTSTVR